jgi:hypothetical protein
VYLYANDLNVIVVDWGEQAGGLDGNTRDRAQGVGVHTGTFMNYLVSMGNDNGRTHCIGFGMGAHICGFAGKQTDPPNQKLGHISGLEPLSDGYDYGDPTSRLYILDAEFVDAIHTCTGRHSFAESIGHADFYPNSGECGQPGCGIEGIVGNILFSVF